MYFYRRDTYRSDGIPKGNAGGTGGFPKAEEDSSSPFAGKSVAAKRDVFAVADEDVPY